MILRRIRVYAASLAVTMWMIWIVDMTVSGNVDRLGKIKGTDFLHFYVMGSIAHEGRWEQLFDVQAHQARAQRVVPGSTDTVYIPIESPQLALLFAPFAAYRYVVALSAWLAVVFALYAGSCALVWRDCVALRAHRSTVAVSCAAFPGLYGEVLHGQAACLEIAAFALALFALRREWRVASGLAFGCLVFKPHWVLAAGAVFFFAREWRVVAGMAVSALVQIAATGLAVGASVMAAYWRALRTIPDIARLLEPKPGDSLRGLFDALVPFQTLALLLYGVAAVGTLWIAARIWRTDASIDIRLAALVIAVVLICPHVNSYDLIVLAPAALMIADWLVRAPDDTGARSLPVWLSLVAAAPLLGGLPALLRLQFSVTAMAAVLFHLWRIARREPAPAWRPTRLPRPR